MKEKMFFRLVLVAGAVTMLAACTSESENGPSANISYESIAAAQQVPVTFGTYMGETATTRYGATGAIDGTSSTLAAQVLANKGGFGVFGYYADNGNYNNTTSLPNFMYNQHVTGTDENPPVWSYTPIKYWPNEYDAGVTSEGTDRLTFFAYAPYTTVTLSTGAATGPGNATSGIMALTGNNTGGDPKVSYTVADNPAESVDLLYGVVGMATNNGPFGTGGDAIAVGGQYIDITKQAVSGKINFDFKHALSRLNFTIQGAFDDDTTPTTADVDANTKITVKSVVINGANFYDSGKLNLNGGVWGDLSGGTAADNMTIDATHYINPDIVDLGADDTHVQADSDGSDALDDSLFGANNTVTGVTKAEKTLTTNATDYYMIIPVSTTISGVTITYFVNTKDTNLNAGYSRVKNVITKTFGTPISVTAGKAYKFKLNVGMTTVKIDASVSAWDTTAGPEEVWLPINTD